MRIWLSIIETAMMFPETYSVDSHTKKSWIIANAVIETRGYSYSIVIHIILTYVSPLVGFVPSRCICRRGEGRGHPIILNESRYSSFASLP